MSNQIHPTAIIGDQVKIGQNNIIGPYAILDGNITIGDNNIVGPYSNFSNNVIIGNNNKFTSYVSVGTLGEMGTKGDVFLPEGIVSIGNNNVFREFISINSPVRRTSTSIKDNGYFMSRTYIPHDAQIGNAVVMATNSSIGGGCTVGDFAYIGFNASIHQWIDIGESAMIGLQAGVTKHTPPFCIVIGTPAQIFKINRVGALRRGYTEQEILEAEQYLPSVIQEGFVSENRIITSIHNFIKGREETMKRFV